MSIVKQFVPPRLVKNVNSFLCFLQYLSKFIFNSAELVAPLHDAVLVHQQRKDKDFAWSDEIQATFRLIQRVVSAVPRLNSFDVNKVTHVVWDASTLVRARLRHHVSDHGQYRRHVIENVQRS